MTKKKKKNVRFESREPAAVKMAPMLIGRSKNGLHCFEF